MTTGSPNSATADLVTRLNEYVSGTKLTGVRLLDYTWFFTFGDAWKIATESYWRLISWDGLAVSFSDHGQLFGLKEPMDAAARTLSALTAPVTRLDVVEPATDLHVVSGEHRLERLNTSSGYEGWRLELKSSPGAQVWIALGGGGLAGW